MNPSRLSFVARLLATVLVLAATTPSRALDLPSRKPGLWSIGVPYQGQTRTIGQCLDESTDKRMRELGETEGGRCTPQVWTQDGDALVGESVCTEAAGAQTKVVTRVTGDFQSSYQVEVSRVSSSTTAALRAPLVLTAKWEGPCSAGQKPGDMILPGGRTVNIEQMTPQ